MVVVVMVDDCCCSLCWCRRAMNTSGVRFGTLIAADGTTSDESAPCSMSRSSERRAPRARAARVPTAGPADPMPCHRFWKKPPFASPCVAWWAWRPTSDGCGVVRGRHRRLHPHGSNAGESGSSLGSESSLCVDLPFDNRRQPHRRRRRRRATLASSTSSSTDARRRRSGRRRCPRWPRRCKAPLPTSLAARRPREVLRPDRLDALRLPLEACGTPPGECAHPGRSSRPPGGTG